MLPQKKKSFSIQETKENLQLPAKSKIKSGNQNDYVFKRYKIQENQIFNDKTNALDSKGKGQFLTQDQMSQKAKLQEYKQNLKTQNMDVFCFDEDEEQQDEESRLSKKAIQQTCFNEDQIKTQSLEKQGQSLQNQSTEKEHVSPTGVTPMELVDFQEQSEISQCREQKNSDQRDIEQGAGESIHNQKLSCKIEDDSSSLNLKKRQRKDRMSNGFAISPISLSPISLNHSLDQYSLQDSACVILKKCIMRKDVNDSQNQISQNANFSKEYELKNFNRLQNLFQQEEVQDIEQELKGIKIHSIPLSQDVTIQILDKDQFVSSKIPPGVIIKCKLKRSSGFLNIVNPEFDFYLQNGLKHLVSVKKNVFRNRQIYLFSTKVGSFKNPIRRLMANVLHNAYWFLDEPKLIGKKNISYLDGMIAYQPLSQVKVRRSTSRAMKVLIPPSLKSYHIGLEYETSHIDFNWFMNNIAALQLSTIQKQQQSSPQASKILPSQKNFCLFDNQDEEYVYLKMQKQSENVFGIEIQHPLTPLQAVAIIMTRFDAQLKF